MKKIMLGLSGGVDSALSAALLLEQGHQVVGVYLRAWDPASGEEALLANCPWQDDVADAARLAAQLDIPFSVVDVRDAYQKKVTKVLEAEYAAGRTPNPDILCNREMKFGLMLGLATELGFDGVATGHYAQIKDGLLHRGDDEVKDQTYFLWTLTKKQLSKIIFPIGHLTKEQVRHEASDRNLVVATKKDSQGICFLGPIKLRQYLKTRLKTLPGKVVDIKGEIVGQHLGVNLYTLGQRDGLGIFGGEDQVYYVVAKDLKANTLIVDSKPPQTRDLYAAQLNLLVKLKLGDKIEARIRHGQIPQGAVVKQIDKNSIQLKFKELQNAVTPGQSVVFSKGTKILGGGIIAVPN